MKRLLPILMLAGFTAPLAAAEKDSKLYELRVYWAAEGKLDALNARFRDHTMKLFEKHGMTNICYWVPLDSKDHRLVYVLCHKDKATADASWKGFMADEEWKKVYAESEKGGKLATKVEHVWLTKTDFSPEKPGRAEGEHVFELRTYVATPNNLPLLLDRFRNHTTKLFEKHGITNIAYTTIADSDKITNGKLLKALSPAGGEKADVKADDEARGSALIYVLAHKDEATAKKNFEAFRADSDWIAAKAESEKKGGGSLTAKDGVKSLFLKTTDYSPNK
jgi:hypothetical protein